MIRTGQCVVHVGTEKVLVSDQSPEDFLKSLPKLADGQLAGSHFVNLGSDHMPILVNPLHISTIRYFDDNERS
jgi:hypothetical protein